MKKIIILLLVLLGASIAILSVTIWNLTIEYRKGSRFSNLTCFKGPQAVSYPDPGCSMTEQSQNGEITYKFNEESLRERPMAEIKEGQVLVLGSNVVEGMALPAESTLSHLLEAKLAASVGLQFINFGKSLGGTTVIGNRTVRLAPKFKPRHILWVLGEEDVRQDLYLDQIATGRDEAGVPVRFNREVLNQKDGILALASSLLGGVAPGSLVHKSVISYLWAERLGSRISGFDPCKGIRKVEKFFNGSGTSMKFVLLPTGPEHSSRVLKAHLSMLSVCATGHVLDLTESLGSAEYFQANHIDLSKAGVEKAADLIAKSLEEEWRSAR